jgi:Arabinose-binding domain of AraC transcription regulator, N-term
MSNRSSSALNSEKGLASIPMAQGGLSRLAVARLESAGVPVAPLLKRVGLTSELIADPEERLSVQSQIRLLDETAIALKDDCLGFTLACDFEPREIGLLYYVMASSQTLGEFGEIESAVRMFKVARPFEIDLHRLRIHLRMVQADLSRMAALN